MLWLGIAVAGAFGALSRWGLDRLFGKWAPTFPYGTLAANLAGCFLLGLTLALAEHARWMSNEMRVVLAVGFVGTLTTFSTWQLETLRMALRGDVLLAAGNFAVNVFFGFLLIWAGGRLVAGAWR
ncbi:MAG: fluoride efflux transporter FluC [Terriglobales bacterium]